MAKEHLVYDTQRVDICYIPLKDLILKIKHLIEDHGEDAHLEIRENYDQYDVVVEWSRPENALEKASRLATETRQKEHRRQNYEKLKKEFGDA